MYLLFGGVANAASKNSDLCIKGQLTWKIDQIQQNGLADISLVGGNLRIGSGVRESDVPALVRYFKAADTDGLVGKTFHTSCRVDRKGVVFHTDPLATLDYLAMRANRLGVYTPPSDEILFDRAVEALARMEQPIFDIFAEGDVAQSFAHMYHGKDAQGLEAMSPAFFAALAQHVADASGGTVTVETADDEEFSIHSRCGCTSYMALVNHQTGQRQLMLVGPYVTPFMFDRGHAVTVSQN